MPKAYSLDLRQRVARFVEGGRSCHAAAVHFSVSVSFVVRLMKSFRATGRLAPKPSGGRRHAKLDPHRPFLLARIAEKADMTMPELSAELAAASGTKAVPPHSRAGSSTTATASKKPCWRASKIAPTLKRRARNGPPHASRECGLNRIGWSFSTRPERQPKDPSARPPPEGPAAPLQGAFRALDDPDLRRRPALRQAHRPLRRQCPDEPVHLRDLCRERARPNPRQRRCRHHGQFGSWTIWPPTRARPPRKPSRPGVHGSCSCHPTALTSIRSKWPSPSLKLISAQKPSGPSMPSGRRSGTSAISSSLPNAKTTSPPPDMDSAERPAL